VKQAIELDDPDPIPAMSESSLASSEPMSHFIGSSKRK